MVTHDPDEVPPRPHNSMLCGRGYFWPGLDPNTADRRGTTLARAMGP